MRVWGKLINLHHIYNLIKSSPGDNRKCSFQPRTSWEQRAGKQHYSSPVSNLAVLQTAPNVHLEEHCAIANSRGSN